MTRRIGIFGGTFDPVHYGHIDSARCLVAKLSLDTLYFMPCQQHPFHKHPGASPAQRADMLILAVADEARLAIDTRELRRDGISYTVDSLQEIRNEHGDDAVIVFILGTDAFASLHQWQRWQSLLSLANMAVIERAGQITTAQINEPELKALLAQSVTAVNASHGELIQLVLEPYPISSTVLRSALAAIHRADQQVDEAQIKMINEFIPASVVQYIEAQQLYQSNH
ncbi:nicotinate-nucleotide adenylyltransferase [Pseudomonadales bacterium]|nr:nicotinate-nucleotide adenylyltransferase [Pseudomonadales bacterium]